MAGASELWSLSTGGVLGTPFLSCHSRNTTVRPLECDHGPGFRRLSSPSLFLCFLTPVLVAAALLSELMVKIVSGLTLKVLSFPRPPPVFKHLKECVLPSSGLPHYPARGSTVLEFIIRDLFGLWASWPLTGMQVPGDALLWLHWRGAREVNWESQKFRNLLTQSV